MKKGYRGINEELNRMKNLVEYKSGNILKEQNDNRCVGVTTKNPPSDFKTKYVNSSSYLYFYGFITTKTESEINDVDAEWNVKENAKMNLFEALSSNESPKPYGNKFAVYKELPTEHLKNFKLKDKVICINKNYPVIMWVVYELPVESFNKLKQEINK